MKSRISIFIFLLYCFTASAGNKDTVRGGGDFSIGIRNTISTFTDAGSTGMGAGGQVRVRVSKHINTEWFADYIGTNIQNLGYRRDAHIGWSVLFYLDKNPLTVGKITPFVLAGHCFDYTRVYSEWPGINAAQRWSSAVQGGFGMHYNITSRFDISLLAQYMLHLGTNVTTSEPTDSVTGLKYLDIIKQSGAAIEGHLLITLSLNYCLGRL